MNQFEITALTGLVTMFLSLSIPIIAVIMSVWNNVKNKEKDTELRKLIVEKQVDTESVRLLIAQMEKKSILTSPCVGDAYWLVPDWEHW